jgi:hypothetical protein
MHEIAIAVDDVAFGAEDGLFAVWAATAGEGCVMGCDTDHLDAIWNGAMSYDGQ